MTKRRGVVAILPGLTSWFHEGDDGYRALYFRGMSEGKSVDFRVSGEALNSVIQKVLGREAVDRLLGEPASSVGTGFNGVSAPDAPLDQMPKIAGIIMRIPPLLKDVDIRLQKAEGRLGQALGRIEKLERSVRQLETTVVHAPDSVLFRLQATKERIEELERLIVHLSPKDLLRRLSDLEAQPQACAAGECECYQAGHEAAKEWQTWPQSAFPTVPKRG
ncbi:MAG: hypothetical protein V3V32_04565 [Dehalococcoidia bacterium]